MQCDAMRCDVAFFLDISHVWKPKEIGCIQSSLSQISSKLILACPLPTISGYKRKFMWWAQRSAVAE